MKFTESGGNMRLLATVHSPEVRNIRKGDTIRIHGHNPVFPSEKEVADWTVEGVYPYFVLCSHGSRHRCVSYGELAQMGLEEVTAPSGKGGGNAQK